MSEKPSITDSIISKVSDASSESLQKIKFGRGVVGKMAVVFVVGIAAIGFGLLRLGQTGALVGIILIFLLCAIAAGLIAFIVVRQPELAVMEGMEVIHYKQLSMGTKDYTPTGELPPVPDPKALPPANHEEGDDDEK